MSYSMRMAFQNMQKYKRENAFKKVLFELGNKKSYSEYFSEYFKNDVKCTNSFLNAKNELSKNVEQLQKNFAKYGDKLKLAR